MTATPTQVLPPAEFFRVPQAVQLAQQSYSTLRRRHLAGHDTGLRKHGRIVLFHVETLKRYLAAGTGK